MLDDVDDIVAFADDEPDVDPLDKVHPLLRRKIIEAEDWKPWSFPKQVMWYIGFVLSLIWAVPFSIAAVAAFITLIGIPIAGALWAIGAGPAAFLMQARLRHRRPDILVLATDNL